MGEIQNTSDNNKYLQIADALNHLKLPDIVKNNIFNVLTRGVGSFISLAESHFKYYQGKVDNKTRLEKEATENTIREEKAESDAKIATIERSTKRAESLDNEIITRAKAISSESLLKGQKSKDYIALVFLELLKNINIKDINSKSIDEDWVTNFWEYAAKTTKKDIQNLLARILANEVITPDSFSPHTLQLLSIMTSKLGHTFREFCRLTIDDGKVVYVVYSDITSSDFETPSPFQNFGISWGDLLELEEVGLLLSPRRMYNKYRTGVVEYGGSNINIDYFKKGLNTINLTKSGAELRRLIDDLSPIPEYTEMLLKMSKEGDKMSFKLLE